MPVTTPFYNLNGVVCYTFDLAIRAAKAEVEKPFAFEDELREKTERLNALNIELNLNEKDRSVMDTEPDQSEEQHERKCANRER